MPRSKPMQQFMKTLSFHAHVSFVKNLFQTNDKDWPLKSLCHTNDTFFTMTSNVNNSAIFQRKMLPKVANERY